MSKSSILKEKIGKLDGYRIRDTHFKIGHKVHSSDFFYAKRLFQNSYYTSRIAVHLAIQIMKKLPSQDVSLTLVGYELYSELLLSLIKKFLHDSGYMRVNHFVTRDLDETINHIPSHAKLLDYAVIIVPIASTGSTAVKIEAYLRSINKGKLPKFFMEHFNVILANDANPNFFEITAQTNNQQSFLRLDATWESPQNCIWCFNDLTLRPLFETDKSSLTPALIFDLPSAKSGPKKKNKAQSEIDLSVDFDQVSFQEALIYRKAWRNNEHFLFSTNTELLIEHNQRLILEWLKGLRELLKISPNDKIVIMSPCHYSNTGFINLVNEQLFNSAATIIHHQTDVDYLSNFRLLNRSYLDQENAKVFFVDDSLISGRHFFAIYDLYKFSTNYLRDLSGAIVLSDKSSPDIHKRVSRASRNLYPFVKINLPISPKVFDRKPLEHEVRRYEDLSIVSLHDVLKQEFSNKADDLKGEYMNREASSGYRDFRGSGKRLKGGTGIPETHRKQVRHVRMFTATHRAYATLGSGLDLRYFTFDVFLRNCGYSQSETIESDYKMAMMKVLSQYPFLLYKPVREKTFEWHKEWLNAKVGGLISSLQIELNLRYDDFRELKFLMRRAVFLGNYSVVKKDFFDAISLIFVTISQNRVFKEADGTLDLSWKTRIYKLDDAERRSLENFHYFLLRQYVELIHKNAWCASRIALVMREVSFSTKQGLQFARMLGVEICIVIKGFYSLLSKESQWINLYKHKNFETEGQVNEINLEIDMDPKNRRIFQYLSNKDFIRTNMFEICNLAMSLREEDGTLRQSFLNFLWIRQFINSDITFNLSNIPLTRKTESIFEKARGLFSDSNRIGVFFIVSDGADAPHLVYDRDSEKNAFLEEIDPGRHRIMIKFLEGDKGNNGLKYKTIIEYKRESLNKWSDTYALEPSKPELPFMGDYRWLMLVRISNDDSKSLGLMGFYSNEDVSNDLLARQLLMLVREDMGLFIKKHHKNDEFSALREAEAVKRFAYLAGHGRQMMQKLANEDHNIFGGVVATMEKLQFLFATNYISPRGNASHYKEKNIKELLHGVFSREKINSNSLDGILKMGREIYLMDVIENSVKIEPSSTLPNFEEFDFNPDIFSFICFELFVNAKKNRFHFLANYPCTSCNHTNTQLDVQLSVEGGVLEIQISGIGPKVPEWIESKIKQGQVVKDDNELSGLNLIGKVLRVFDSRNSLKLKSTLKCDHCKVSENRMKVRLYPMNRE